MTQVKEFSSVRQILKRMIKQGYLLSDTNQRWFMKSPKQNLGQSIAKGKADY